MTKAYWCLGSNIDSQKNITFAITQFRQTFSDVSISSFYRCPAVGFVGEDFLNVVLTISTDRSLEQLLKYADQLEQNAGRTRVARGRFDSRTLDVDLLMYGNLQGEHAGRDWPSKDITDYAHVLGPLAELAGNDRHPDSGQTLAAMWQAFDKSKARLTKVSL